MEAFYDKTWNQFVCLDLLVRSSLWNLHLDRSGKGEKCAKTKTFFNLANFQIIPDLLESHNCQNNLESSFENFECFAFEYLPSFTITFFNVVLPFVFTYLVIYERYATNTELIVNLSRYDNYLIIDN